MPSAEQRRLLAALVAKYHENLIADPDGGAAAYLAERGITRRAIDRFQLGYSGDTGSYKNADRLAIPYLSPAGPWHVKYRCIADHNCKDLGHGKYIYDDGAEQHLFNAQTLLTAERVVVVEGELDAVSVEAAGVPAVAYPGAETWKKNRHWRWCFDSVTEVIVVGDGDTPREGKEVGVGEEAAKAVADTLRQSLPDIDVRMVVMPLGHDANSFINTYGQVDFLAEIGAL